MLNIILNNIVKMLPYLWHSILLVIVMDMLLLKKGSKGLTWTGEVIRFLICSSVLYIIHNRANMGTNFDISLVELMFIIYINLVGIILALKFLKNMK